MSRSFSRPCSRAFPIFILSRKARRKRTVRIGTTWRSHFRRRRFSSGVGFGCRPGNGDKEEVPLSMSSIVAVSGVGTFWGFSVSSILMDGFLLYPSWKR